MGYAREIRKKNDENLMRINLICEQGRLFLDKIESDLLEQGSSNSYLFQMIEKSKAEIAQLRTRYASFVEECNFDLILIDNGRVKHLKETVEMITSKITDIVYGDHTAHTPDYAVSNRDNDPNQRMEL